MNKEIAALLVRRIAVSLVILFLMVSFLFFLLRISPGNPAQKYVSPNLSPELTEKIKESFHLDDSLLKQYESFLLNLAQGDLGVSYNYRIPVSEVIAEYLPFTIFFAVASIIVQLVIGFIMALAAVKNINGTTDKILSRLSLMMYSAPSFVVGVILILVFSEKLNLFPSSGLQSFDSYSYSFFGKLFDYAEHLVLPIVTLAFGGIAVYFKYLRENLEDVYNRAFVLNLRASGYSEKEILIKHVIPNAINPVVSIIGVELGILFSGALITEVIFGLPGMGRLTISAILTRDYPVVMGCTFAAGLFVIICNLLADIVKALLDKRVLRETLG